MTAKWGSGLPHFLERAAGRYWPDPPEPPEPPDPPEPPEPDPPEPEPPEPEPPEPEPPAPEPPELPEPEPPEPPEPEPPEPPELPDPPDPLEVSEAPLLPPPEVPDALDVPVPLPDVPPEPEAPLLSWFFFFLLDVVPDDPELSDAPDELVMPAPDDPDEVPPVELCATATPLDSADTSSATKTLFMPCSNHENFRKRSVIEPMITSDFI